MWRWPLLNSALGPSPLWLRKECVTAGHRMKGENVSHEFPSVLQLLYVVAWSLSSSTGWLTSVTYGSATASGWQPLTFHGSLMLWNSSVQSQLLTWKGPLQKLFKTDWILWLYKVLYKGLFASQVDRFQEIMVIKVMAISVLWVTGWPTSFAAEQLPSKAAESIMLLKGLVHVRMPWTPWVNIMLQHKREQHRNNKRHRTVASWLTNS